MNKISSTKVGYLHCKKCEKYSLAVTIPFDKKVMDKFELHTENCLVKVNRNE